MASKLLNSFRKIRMRSKRPMEDPKFKSQEPEKEQQPGSSLFGVRIQDPKEIEWLEWINKIQLRDEMTMADPILLPEMERLEKAVPIISHGPAGEMIYSWVQWYKTLRSMIMELNYPTLEGLNQLLDAGVLTRAEHQIGKEVLRVISTICPTYQVVGKILETI
ncbi:hypothetical protein [Ghana virus]|uniref:C protein n=1 Tax=Ghana virus TaxID=2847089 RepID=I0E090_9MONO|nr:hypothetical protein [Ghana virus]AFH96008.1 hypothetical protein [Ghana virus]